MASKIITDEESLQIQPQGGVEKELPQILGSDVQDDGAWGGSKAEIKRKKWSEEEGQRRGHEKDEKKREEVERRGRLEARTEEKNYRNVVPFKK